MSTPIAESRRRELFGGGRKERKYTWLKRHLISEMSAGHLRPGDALPSEARLAEAFQLARTTVRRALTELERDGLVRRESRRGTFVREQSPAQQRSKLDALALVVPETRSGFYPSLLHGFEGAAKKWHNRTVVCSTEYDVDKQGNIMLQLIHDQVSGVALLPMGKIAVPAYQVQQLHERGIPVVCCHRAVEGVSTPVVRIPFDQVGRVAGQAFLEHGHRRVAFFALGPDEVCFAYKDGLRQTLRAGGGDLPEQFIHYGSAVPDAAEQEEAVFEALKRMCATADRPTAILASFDTLAELIYLLLGRLGLEAPRDISLVGFGGTWRQGPVAERLTSVVVDEAQLGRRAVELLDEMRAGTRPLDDDEQVVMPLSLTEGRTLGPAPQQPVRISGPHRTDQMGGE